MSIRIINQSSFLQLPSVGAGAVERRGRTRECMVDQSCTPSPVESEIEILERHSSTAANSSTAVKAYCLRHAVEVQLGLARVMEATEDNCCSGFADSEVVEVTLARLYHDDTPQRNRPVVALRLSEMVERKLPGLGIGRRHLDAAGRLEVDVHANKVGLVLGRTDVGSLENWPNTRGLGHPKSIHLHSCRKLMSFVVLY